MSRTTGYMMTPSDIVTIAEELRLALDESGRKFRPGHDRRSVCVAVHKRTKHEGINVQHVRRVQDDMFGPLDIVRVGPRTTGLNAEVLERLASLEARVTALEDGYTRPKDGAAVQPRTTPQQTDLLHG